MDAKGYPYWICATAAMRKTRNLVSDLWIVRDYATFALGSLLLGIICIKFYNITLICTYSLAEYKDDELKDVFYAISRKYRISYYLSHCTKT